MMAAVSDKSTPHFLDGVFRGLFFISKWIGLFPYQIKNGKFNRSYLLYAVSTAIVGGWCTFVIKFVDFQKLGGNDHLLKKLSYYLPIFTLFTVFPCNIIWLSFNGKKLDYVLSTLKTLNIMVENNTSRIHLYKKLFVTVLLSEMLLEVYLFYNKETNRNINFVYMFMVLCTFLIADQFSSVLYVLKSYYQYLCDELDLGSAVELTNCHDLLAKCCRELNDCYSPQLLLVMTSVFVYIVSTLYTLIIKYMMTKNADFVQVYYIAMFVATIFHFLTACRQTTLQSKQFDNLLYRLIINDKSKSLMKNNRILLHFKAMKELEFTAMEFFNFDYSLICSVVSTATTYIVILVQFS